MSTLKTTNIAHPSSASNDIVLDASGNVNLDAGTLYVDASNNRVGIGTTTVSDLLHVRAATTPFVRVDHTTTSSYGAVRFYEDTTLQASFEVLGSSSAKSNAVQIWNFSNAPTIFATNNTERMKIEGNGDTINAGIYNFTTANAANVYVFSSGELRRSTSSGKYKTNVETLEDSYSDALLSCRPVWYRSTCDKDNPNWGWWGFIAEEVAEIDPRLVHWKTAKVTYDENGSAVSTPCDPEPEGVQYDRFVPHLLNLIKRQKEQIETLETRLTALEGGAS